jgi:putative endonuclease
MKRRETGNLGEKLAAEFLKSRGYQVMEANYRCPEGEVDIVTRKDDQLVFIEVRTKKSLEFGSPEESITVGKKERIIAAAYHYQQDHANPPGQWRIDVVAIELDRRNRPLRIELIENAVGEE